MVPPILIAMAKTLGKDVAIAVISEKILGKISNKVGKEATDAGINHLNSQRPRLNNVGRKLLDRRSRPAAISTLSQVGLGTLGAALVAKFSTKESTSEDILAEQKAPAPGTESNKEENKAADQNHSASQREENRVKNEESQKFAIRHGFH